MKIIHDFTFKKSFFFNECKKILVCILGKNAPEWNISNLAAVHAQGFATGIYQVYHAYKQYDLKIVF